MESVKKQKSKSEDKLRKEECKCGSCLKAVLDQESGVMCEICNNWYHCRCQGIGDQLYSILNQYAELHWFCKGCQAGADKLLALLTRMQTKVDKLEDELARTQFDIRSEMTNAIQQLKTDLAGVNHRCDEYEKKVEEYKKEMNDMIAEKLPDMVADINNDSTPSWSEIVAKEIDTRMSSVSAEVATLQQQTKIIQQDKQEQEEIDRRKTNLILHGMVEAADANGAQEEDENGIADILHVIGCDDVSVESVIRLGRKSDEEGAKPRPIKLVLASESQKDKVLRKSKNLRSQTDNRFSAVFMHQDLTPLQRERRHMLLQELKNRRDQGETNLVLRNWKIVSRWDRQESWTTALAP